MVVFIAHANALGACTYALSNQHLLSCANGRNIHACVSICDHVRNNQPYVGEINFEIRAFIAISGIY